MAVVPGKAVSAMAVVVDEVEKTFELFLRIRAYFMTLSLVSVTIPGWFPLQIAILASDQILGAVSNTYRGKYPQCTFWWNRGQIQCTMSQKRCACKSELPAISSAP